MSDFLKGNYPVKREIIEKDQNQDAQSSQELAAKLRKAALASIGGSMVYMERTDLTWNGDDK